MVVLTRSPPRSSRPPGPRRSRARLRRRSPPRPAARRRLGAGSSGALRDRLVGRRLGGGSSGLRLGLGWLLGGRAVPVAVRRGHLLRVTLLWPAAMPSAIASTIRLHERIASSLPGMMKSASSGSQFVSTSAMIGTPSRRASRTASCSFLRSTMKTASGCRRQVGDAAEVRLELLELGEQRDPLLRGQQLELTLALEAAQLVQVRDPVGDRPPVRQQAAEPAVRDVRHADAARLLRRRRPAPASSCRRRGSCRRAPRGCARSRTPPGAARRSGSDR